MVKRSKINGLRFRRIQPYWALVVFLILAFLTGGGSRADIQSLMLLRPAAVIFCGIGLWSLTREHINASRFLFGMTAAIFALVGAHLIPLPPSIWGSFPGREIIGEVDRTAKLGEVWRPISMVPSGTWNALYSLFVPLAVLVLGVQVNREGRHKILLWVIGLGLVSGFWSILQIAGPRGGPLYLYRVVNSDAAVGLFSNRNHQAIMLASLFPMLAVYASTSARSEEQWKLRLWLAIAASVVLVPLVLVTGSRTGLILGLVGLASTPFVYRKPSTMSPRKRKNKGFDVRYPLAAFGILCLGALTIIMSRAEALKRLIGTADSDLRLQMWPSILEMSWTYLPIGSGIGSFVEVYQIGEPLNHLSLSYLNHAHNDWLELFLTAGLPGMALSVIALTGWALATRQAWAKSPSSTGRIIYARLGSVVLLLLALGSMADYPLRTPSLACVFVLAALWLTEANCAMPENDGTPAESQLGETRSF